MTKSERIGEVVRSSLEQLNSERLPNQRISFDPSTLLAKPRGTLDSLSLVGLMVDLEVGLENEFGITISLAEVAGTPDGAGMFVTVGTLTAALLQQVEGLADV
ncbi:MAG: hypothetical protein C0398_07250 [Coprothermobacter sp.]|nr:hypothetical protein [Coprothermobacter sp.]